MRSSLITCGFLAVFAASSCGTPKERCSSTTCSGCCDVRDTCVTGNAQTACGSGGSVCQTCPTSYTCQLAFCRAPSSGTGGGGGSSVVRYGNSTPYTTTSTASAGYLLGTRLMINSNFQITHFGVVTSTAVDARFALYSETDGGPGTIVASTARTALTVGSQEIPAQHEVDVSPGAYWFMAVYASMAEIHVDDATTNLVHYVYWDISDEAPYFYPASSSTTYSGAGFNYWVVGR